VLKLYFSLYRKVQNHAVYISSTTQAGLIMACLMIPVQFSIFSRTSTSSKIILKALVPLLYIAGRGKGCQLLKGDANCLSNPFYGFRKAIAKTKLK
jgi:hypothetical protein